MKYFFIIFILLIVLAVVVIGFFAYMAQKYQRLLNSRRIKDIEDESVYRKKKPHPSKKTDHRSRDKKEEKKIEDKVLSGVELYDPNQQQVSRSQGREEGVKIVGMAQPVGFWSKFVMSQKMGYIMARMQFQEQDKGQKGYWESLIKAQAASQSKEQNRGR